MPAKKRKPQKGGKRKRKTARPGLGPVQNGKGWFGDAVKWTNGALKSTKIASTVMGLSPDPRMQAAARVAKQAGYGKQPNQLYGVNRPAKLRQK